jgi:hypothetical protein
MEEATEEKSTIERRTTATANRECDESDSRLRRGVGGGLTPPKEGECRVNCATYLLKIVGHSRQTNLVDNFEGRLEHAQHAAKEPEVDADDERAKRVVPGNERKHRGEPDEKSREYVESAVRKKRKERRTSNEKKRRSANGAEFDLKHYRMAHCSFCGMSTSFSMWGTPPYCCQAWSDTKLAAAGCQLMDGPSEDGCFCWGGGCCGGGCPGAPALKSGWSVVSPSVVLNGLSFIATAIGSD